MSVEEFDRAYRRRMTIAISISVVVNAIVFGAAGVTGHNFLHSLQIMRDKKPDVTIRRVFVRDLPGGGIQLVPDNGPSGRVDAEPSNLTGPKAH